MIISYYHFTFRARVRSHATHPGGLSTMPSVVEVNEEASRHGSLSTDAEPWQRHNGRLSATDRPFVIDSEPPQSETKFEDVVDQVTLCCAA